MSKQVISGTKIGGSVEQTGVADTTQQIQNSEIGKDLRQSVAPNRTTIDGVASFSGSTRMMVIVGVAAVLCLAIYLLI